MKKTPFLFAASFLLLALPWAVSAQEADSTPPAKSEKTESAPAPEKVDAATQAKIDAGIQKLEATLKLKPEQTEQVRKIIAKSVQETQAELTKLKAKLEKVKDRTSEDIKKVLDPEQKKIYEDMLSQQAKAQAAGVAPSPFK